MYDTRTTVAEMHRLDLLKEAEQRRLLKQGRIALRKSPTPLHYHTLAAVGRRLSAWGAQLQERYAEPVLTAQ